jgi:hypothetical protein
MSLDTIDVVELSRSNVLTVVYEFGHSITTIAINGQYLIWNLGSPWHTKEYYINQYPELRYLDAWEKSGFYRSIKFKEFYETICM